MRSPFVSPAQGPVFSALRCSHARPFALITFHGHGGLSDRAPPRTNGGVDLDVGAAPRVTDMLTIQDGESLTRYPRPMSTG
ncbi:hypothetical protein GCM10007967_19820 [Xylanimonas ulmi]